MTEKYIYTWFIASCVKKVKIFFLQGEEKLNILEIVKPVETVEVVIDPDAAGEEGALVEEGQLIAVERSSLSDETSEQVTRWAAALEGYRKEQVRLGIPYGEELVFIICINVVKIGA